MKSTISYSKIWRLSLPVMLSQLGQITVGIADNIMIGRLGTIELAAASFANTILNLAIIFGMGVSFILTPLVGESLKGRGGKPAFLFKNSLVVNLVAGLLISLILYLLSLVFQYMGQEQLVTQMAKSYYFISALSVVPLMLFFTFKQFAEGVGNTRTGMYIILVANGVNVLFNYLFMYGVWGFPQLNLNGAAMGTIIARIFMLFAFWAVFLKQAFFKKYFKRYAFARLNYVVLSKIARKGLLLGIQMLIEASAFGLAGIMVGWLGATGLAAHQIAMSLSTLGFMVYQGVGAATTILVSQYSTDSSVEPMQMVAKKAARLVVPLSLGMSLLFYGFRHWLPLAYSSSAEVQSIASVLLIVLAVYQLPDALQIIYSSAVRGLADVKVPVFLLFCSYFLLALPASYYFAFVADFKQLGIWMGFPPGLLVAYWLLKFRFKRVLVGRPKVNK